MGLVHDFELDVRGGSMPLPFDKNKAAGGQKGEVLKVLANGLIVLLSRPGRVPL